MNKDTETQIQKLNTSLTDTDIQQEVDAIAIETADQKLRRSLLGYVSTQVEEVRKIDSVIALALTKLYDRLQSNELDVDKVLSIVSTLSNKKTDLTTAILDPFKASPGGTNSLLPPAKENAEITSFERGIKDMTPEQLKVFDRMFRIISDAEK